MAKFLIKQAACFRQIPLLLLVISCGISSGTLMTIAVLMHIIIAGMIRHLYLGRLLTAGFFGILCSLYSLLLLVHLSQSPSMMGMFPCY